MNLFNVLQIDLEQELRKTRKLLEAVPDDKGDWRPHPKSSTLGSLAKHVASLPLFATRFLTTDSMDATGGPPPAFEFKGREDLLRTLDTAIQAMHEALSTTSDEELMQEWTFYANGKVLYTASRAVMFRTMFFNHLIHHRGQLTVYLRLLEIPVPGLYGPSADLPWEITP